MKSMQEKKEKITNLFYEFASEINAIRQKQIRIKQNIDKRKTQKEIDKIRKNISKL